MKRRLNINLCMAVLALVLIIGTAVVNISTISDAFGKLFMGESSFDSFTTDIQNAYTSGIVGKDFLLDVNGLFARLSGRKVYNGVVMLNNGMLNWEKDTAVEVDVEGLAQHTIAFSKELKKQDVEFLYVQAVQKPDQNNELLPEGVENYGNAHARKVVDALVQAGVNTLDMAPEMNLTIEMVEKNYYRTDHHWTNEMAFVCYQRIAQRLQEMFPERVVDMMPTLLENWEPHTVKNCFMGSQARRVGKWYGGLDDITWYTPRFETDLMWVEPYDDDFAAGSFENINVHMGMLRADFSTNSYAVLGGGDRNLLVRYNPHAPNDLHIVMVKDSYANPTAAFLSAFCRRIDIIDPRWFQDSISRYIQSSKPDAVIWLVNSGALEMAVYHPPVEEWKKADAATAELVLDGLNVDLTQNDVQVIAEVPGSKMCRLSMEGIRFEQETLPLLEIELSTDEGGFPVFSQLIEPDQEQLEWVFPMPKNEWNYRVALRAGYAHTRTVPLTFEGVTLEVYDLQE